ncbi:MAG: contractile injection system protein, VgrG/Pvc8 family, partial [Planctomycetota bacterium]
MSNQATYLLEIGPYDEDDLKVLRFESVERISEPFELRVELASTDFGLDFGAFVGKPAAFVIRGPEGDRFLHGVVSQFEQGEFTQHHAFYEVVIRPRLWLLSQRTNSRIFQEKDVPTI